MSNDGPATLASLVCAVVAGNGMVNSGSAGWTHPLMHVNFLAHGIIGILHYQNSVFGADTSKVFPISVVCAKYLGLAGVNADCYRSKNDLFPIAFAILGAVPVFLAFSGEKNEQLGIGVIAVNLICLGYTAFTNKGNFMFALLGASVLTLFVPNSAPKLAFPLGLAVMDFCAQKLWEGVAVAGPPPRK